MNLASTCVRTNGFSLLENYVRWTSTKLCRHCLWDLFCANRLMPSYNGVVTISCIHTLTKLAIRFSQVLPLVWFFKLSLLGYLCQGDGFHWNDLTCNGSITLQDNDTHKFSLDQDRITQLLKTFKDAKIIRWQVRVAALRALLELEFHSKGLESAAVLALQHISDDPSFAGNLFRTCIAYIPIKYEMWSAWLIT